LPKSSRKQFSQQRGAKLDELVTDKASEVGERDPVQEVVEILAGDYRRSGRLLPEDVARICSARNLAAGHISQLAEALRERGISFEDEQVPDSFELGLRRFGPNLPHLAVLTAQEESQLVHAIRTGERLRLELAAGGAAAPEIVRLIKSGDAAREKLVLHNLRLVAWIAKQFVWSRLEFEDLFQEGMSGLLRAVELFDPTLGHRFATYASWWIRQAIHRAIDNSAETIRIPVHRLEAIRRYKRAVRQLREECGVQPSLDRTAAALEWTIEETAFIADLAVRSTVALETPISEDGETTLADIIPDDVTMSPEEILGHRQLQDAVELQLSQLPDREGMVLRRRFGIGMSSDHTLEEVGREFGVTRERIRQIEVKALSRLQKATRRKKLEPFLQ
jgi:RNA polymerase primary sigma factor